LGADDVVVPIHSSNTPEMQNNLFTPSGSSDQFNVIPTTINYHYDEQTKEYENIYQELPSQYIDSNGSNFPGNNDFAPINEYHMMFDIPEGHQKGLFWFHSHQHGSSDRQVRSGMSGGIVVKGIQTAFPVLKNINITEEDADSYGKIMLFKDFNDYLGTGSNKPKFWALNDLKYPEITINSFEDRFWRIGNIGADKYLNLTFVKPGSNPNHSSDLGLPKFLILSRDVSQNYFANLSLTDSILVPPAGRVGLIVLGGEPGETYDLISVDDHNTPQPYGNPDCLDVNNNKYGYLASVTIPAASKSQSLKGLLSPQVCRNTEGGFKCLKSLKLGQLAGGEILPNPNTLASYVECSGEATDTCVVSSSTDPDDKFEFIFNRGYLNPPNQDMVFTMNGELYDGSRINKVVNVGTNQDWKLVNQDGSDHAFHIHQLDFIMTEVTVPNDYVEHRGKRDFYDNYPVECNPATLPKGGQGSHCTLKTLKHGYRDTINLPANSETTVRIPFLNPFITGVFVYHCHILAHEDSGMMQNIKVVNPKSYIPPALFEQWFDKFQVEDNK
ncbi:multicopper oxidase domain-containing protein, partial [Moorena sp. SIO3H5]|uniref:multicopper oxidase family protein n=1 Tax=Moorena sp. SIO3H5 TaxID=2607834 RepID=UPI0013BC83A3